MVLLTSINFILLLKDSINTYENFLCKQGQSWGIELKSLNALYFFLLQFSLVISCTIKEVDKEGNQLD